jgi:hypothetical protein
MTNEAMTISVTLACSKVMVLCNVVNVKVTKRRYCNENNG